MILTTGTCIAALRSDFWIVLAADSKSTVQSAKEGRKEGPQRSKLHKLDNPNVAVWFAVSGLPELETDEGLEVMDTIKSANVALNMAALQPGHTINRAARIFESIWRIQLERILPDLFRQGHDKSSLYAHGALFAGFEGNTPVVSALEMSMESIDDGPFRLRPTDWLNLDSGWGHVELGCRRNIRRYLGRYLAAQPPTFWCDDPQWAAGLMVGIEVHCDSDHVDFPISILHISPSVVVPTEKTMFTSRDKNWLELLGVLPRSPIIVNCDNLKP